MTDKITLSNPTTFKNDASAVTTTANNNATITAAFDNTLSRDGTSPNQMNAQLDMNSNAIINLPAPVSSSSPLRLADVGTNLIGTVAVAKPLTSTVGDLVTWGDTTATTIRDTAPQTIATVNDTNVTLSASGTKQLVNPSTVTAGWTGQLAVGRGGTGASTLTSKGVLYGNGTSAIAANTPNASGTNMYLQQISGGTPTWATISPSDVPAVTNSLANPSGTVGLTAVNGVATTGLRSDGAPALSQAIVPTWSGKHTFLNSGNGLKFASTTKNSTLKADSSGNVSTVQDIVNVIHFGADPTGAADSLSAINSAISAVASSGGVVFFPAGTYKTSGSIAINNSWITLRGENRGATILKANFTNGHTILVGNGSNNPGQVNIEGFQFTPVSQKVGGTEVLMQNGHNCTIRDCVIGSNSYIGFQLEGGSGHYIYTIKDCELNGNGAASSAGIYCGGSAQVVELMVVDTLITSFNYGVYLANVSGAIFNHLDILTCATTGIYMNPAAGQFNAYCFFVNCLVDSSIGHNWVMTDTGGGHVIQVQICNSWAASSATGAGILINSSRADGIGINNSSIVNNATHGIYMAAGKNVVMRGNLLSQNSISAANNYQGIVVFPGCSGITITDNISGAQSGFVGSQQYGIVIGAGSIDGYIVQNNRCPGNITGGVFDGGTGTNKFVGNNLSV